ncbi:glycosyltransferase family 2 protein [Flavobacterium sp. MR2016-29]|uniref:glycosyltransferase family 2 protein n=1 Tax=Flavobacterium sp. MR2016-29 TaxID=2783795 RepID=UPI00188B9D5B|nr:glycosyltransferase family 2 protein [Flavobacterium sp. MR2016-29]MBF4492882.1 glycosyltransferase family 2 protein [Flavobacterium sp. MR2016-29]
MMVLAIIIPYYKLSFFEETLKSLANQTDKRFKVYIGDDASPENPLTLLNQFHGKFEFVYHRFEENLGANSLPKQWERCINLSKEEEWLMILGDDDFIDEKLVELWYSNFESFNQKTAVIRFASKLIFEETNTISEIYSHPIWENATDSFYRKFKHLTRSSLSEYIFSRKSFLKYRFYDYPLAWNSDDRAWLDFSENKPIYTINDSVVYVRLSDINISGKQDNNLAKSLSVISFFKFLIKQKLSFYKNEEREKIVRFYENEINKKRNLKISEWLFLLFFYLKYLDFYSIKKFVKRFLKCILKRNE